MTLRGGVLRETTPSSMAASRFKYNTEQLRQGEFSLAQWLWYWLFIQASLVQILSRSYISDMHLFICFFVTNFFRKIGVRPGLAKEPITSQKWTFCLTGFPSSINDDFNPLLADKF